MLCKTNNFSNNFNKIINNKININNIWLESMKLFSNSCHQIPERSFFIKGYQLPICARCTGLFIGYFIGVYKKIFNKKISIIFILIMGLDGILQLFKIIQSNNRRRFITGVLSGMSFINLVKHSMLKFRLKNK